MSTESERLKDEVHIASFLMGANLADCLTGQPKAGHSRGWCSWARFQILHRAFGRRQDSPPAANPLSLGSIVLLWRQRACLQGHLANAEINRTPGGPYRIMERQHSRRVAVRLLRRCAVHFVPQHISTASDFPVSPSVFYRVVHQRCWSWRICDNCHLSP